MSGPRKVYRFAKPSHWASCLTHRFDAGADGSLASIPRFAATATRVDEIGPVSAVALGPHGTPYWRRDASAQAPVRDSAGLLRLEDPTTTEGPFEIEGALAASPRWVIDREWIWAFEPGDTRVHRYERDTLQHDFSIDVSATIRDLASDGKLGIWVLIELKDKCLELVHIDCEGCWRRRLCVPSQACDPTQLGSVQRGRVLVLLGGGNRLTFVDASTGAMTRLLNIGGLLPCWSAAQLATDGQERIAVRGEQLLTTGSKTAIVVLNGSGDTIDRLMDGPFDKAISLAVHRNAVWFGTDAGLWRVGDASAADARESESTLLTPVLHSPDSDSIRGWLRAEVFVNLPQGAVLEAEYRTTDDQRVVNEARDIAANRSSTAEQRQAQTWALFEPDPTKHFRFSGPTTAGLPVTIPLFSSRDRWLWLRLTLVTPPGTPPPPIREMRVLYPDATIAQQLPAAFKGERKDPTGFMRRLAGVLESTTQPLDDRISQIGAQIDPRTAPPSWYDFIARWIDLPWDDALPVEIKKRLLLNAGELLDKRGTRAGLSLLLQCLAGRNAGVEDLTVDYDASFINGAGRSGARLPALLAGTFGPSLGKAVIGHARLCPGTDPLDVLAPTVRIEVAVDRDAVRTLEPLLQRVLLQYIPAGLKTDLRWVDPTATGNLDEGLVLDANGPGLLGRDSAIGRTVIGGRRGRLDQCGLSLGFTLR